MNAYRHDYRDLIRLFNDCFSVTFNTRLLLGDAEPLYLPANESRDYHAIFFAHGFFSSALHECAHWCIAGKKRRQQEDYGYWYIPDGRNLKQQALFQQVEVKPQALEWLFSMACGHQFHFSLDNLNGSLAETEAFKTAVAEQVFCYQQQGLPSRAAIFCNALYDFYKINGVRLD